MILREVEVEGTEAVRLLLAKALALVVGGVGGAWVSGGRCGGG
jgi:hypothetical protein